MKINRNETYIICAGVAQEGIDFGFNEEHDAVLILEDEDGQKKIKLQRRSNL